MNKLILRVFMAAALFLYPLHSMAQSGPPVTDNDLYNTNWDTPLAIPAPGVLVNDQDPDGHALQAHLVQTPGHGHLSLEVDGSFSYAPEPGFAGTVTFVYKAWSGVFGSEATVTIDIVAGNLSPVARDDYYVSHGETLYINAPGVLSNDTDPEEDALEVWPEVAPQNGSFGLSQDGSFWYQPDTGYHGEDSFSYILSDGLAHTRATAFLSVVGPTNQAPVVTAEPFAVDFDQVAVLDALLNASDPDGDALYISRICCIEGGGTAEIIDSAQRIRYTPAAGFRGEARFVYFVSDGQTEVAVPMIFQVGQDDFHAEPDHARTFEENAIRIDVMANDILPLTPGSPAVSLASVSAPENGAVEIDGTEIVYTPAPGFTGADRLTYTLAMGAETRDAQVTILVDPNHPPAVQRDSASTQMNTPVVIDVLANDYEPNGQDLSIVYVSSGSFGFGTTSLDPVTQLITFTPRDRYVGLTSFYYRVSDGRHTVYVPVDVTIRSTATFIPQDDAAQTTAGNSVEINVGSNDPFYMMSMSVGNYTINSFEQPANGTVSLSGDPRAGRLLYTPDPGFTGVEEFTYTATWYNATAQATVRVTVLP